MSRSLGIVTRVIALGVAALAVAVYEATRTDADSVHNNGGHRRLSHTIPGCVLFGSIVGIAVWVHPIAGSVSLALMCGLTAQGYRRIGVGFTLGSGVGSWIVLTHYPHWSWLFPIVVALGAWVHCWGDTITSSGTPMLWPLTRDGKRWATVRTPVTFRTASPFETEVMTPVLTGLLILAAGVMVVTPQTIWHLLVNR